MVRRSAHEEGLQCAGDPSRPDYPEVAAPSATSVGDIDAALVDCSACPRLVQWRGDVAAVKRRAFRDWEYWGKPVPGLGPAAARIVLVGLAPAAHGGNRTGRIFTGDPSGDVLYAALHTVGLASQPTSAHRGDGLEVRDVRITVPVHCAPPDNQPNAVERATCRPWLLREMQLMRPTVRVAVALGRFAWEVMLPVLAETGWPVPRPRPKFGHGRRLVLPGQGGTPDLHVLGCFHPSQRNMSTRTLTMPMLENVLHDAVSLAGL